MRVQQSVGAYLDGELADGAARGAGAAHCGAVAQCVSELESLRRVSGVLQAWEGPQLSAMAMGRLHQRIDAENFNRLRRLALSLSSLAASLALATMLWAYQGGSVAAPAAWERIAITPAAPRTTDELATGTAEEVATAQWVVTDLGFGGADK